MAEFSKLIITTKGQALIAKSLAGAGAVQVCFTKICTSDAVYTMEELERLDDISEVRQTSLVSKVSYTNDVTVKAETSFTNTELTAGYYIRTLGLYALDPDGDDILFAAASEISGNCYIPAYGNTAVSGIYVTLTAAIGNAETVSLEVDSAAFATAEALREVQTQLTTHTGNENIHITTTEREKWNAGSLVSGSNEVGSYLKFPDGTMLEWGTAVDEAVPANGQKQKSIAFPVAFSGIPSVTATAEADTSKGAVTTQIGSIAKTIVYIYAYNTAPVDRTVPIHWQAIGRWK